jgi:hypothetical protein
LSRRIIAALAVTAAVLAPVASASAAPKLSVFAKAIDNPRGLALAPDGTLYVAAAGRAGPKCLDKKKETCLGYSSRVLSISPQGVNRAGEVATATHLRASPEITPSNARNSGRSRFPSAPSWAT